MCCDFSIGLPWVSILISLASLLGSIYFFKRNSRQNVLKTLILDYNIKHLYAYFDEIEKELECLRDKGITLEQKQQINNNQMKSAQNYEQKFIDLFLFVDDDLRKKLVNEINDLTDNLTEAIFNEGINLYVKEIFSSHISDKVSYSKSKILSILIEKCQ